MVIIRDLPVFVFHLLLLHKCITKFIVAFTGVMFTMLRVPTGKRVYNNKNDTPGSKKVLASIFISIYPPY